MRFPAFMIYLTFVWPFYSSHLFGRRMPPYTHLLRVHLCENCRVVRCRDYNFVSFCHVFIQLLACNPKPGCLCHLQHILSSAEYVNQTHVPDFLFYNMVDNERLTLCSLLFLFVSGANQKKPSAPDMFTESDDMFAADFDVSMFNSRNTVVSTCDAIKK